MTKPQHDTLDLCTRAGVMLKAAGFELRYVSEKSEACYFGWPGREVLIRVASHSQRGKSLIGLPGKVIDRTLTFTPEKFASPGHMRLSEDAFRTKVALAIGNYLIRMSEPPPPSRYRGKRGTWEHLAQAGKARRAETALAGSVHEHAVATNGSDAP